jgi:hypothetical protein
MSKLMPKCARSDSGQEHVSGRHNSAKAESRSGWIALDVERKMWYFFLQESVA